MAVDQSISFGSEAKTDKIQLREHSKSKPLELTDAALRTLSTEINEEQTKIEIIEQIDGTVRLKATDHVGIVSLPDGPTIEIRPKVPGTVLLSLLKYSHGVQATTIEESTPLTAGRAFVEALAALYKAELDTALEQGLHREYLRTSESVTHLRGQLDVKRQLQRQGPTPTEFECTFDELTVDTTVNRAVLYATTLLKRFVRDPQVSQALDRHAQQLQRRVTKTPIQAVDLDRIELNRLVSHYTDLLRLTKLVLRSIYVQELRSGSRSSYALLVSMNSIFEKAVERGAKEAVSEWSGWTVDGQASSQGLVTGGKRRFTIRPDVVIRNEDGRPIVVGDAKWKLHEPESNSPEPSNEDIYQLIAYELAHDVPGLLFYPEQEGRISSKYHIQRLHELHTVEIPLRSPAKNSESFPERIKQKIGSAIADIAPMG